MKECSFCLEDVRIPVRFRCFPCVPNLSGPSCHSIRRVCLLCARTYLELNKEASNRSTRKKCPTCPSVTNCRRLNASNAYEKDYRMMAEDPRTDYACFHKDKGCAFVGNQMDLDKHMKTCDHRTVSCRDCHDMFPMTFEKQHEQTCPHRFSCRICEERIRVVDATSHFMNAHQSTLCVCDEFVSLDRIAFHRSRECPRRRIRCEECGHEVYAMNRKTHLTVHLTSAVKAVQEAQALVNRQVEKVKRLGELLERV